MYEIITCRSKDGALMVYGGRMDQIIDAENLEESDNLYEIYDWSGR
jgi:hypothetical protein